MKGGRITAWFARIGLATTAVSLLACLLLVDLLVTGSVPRRHVQRHNTFDLNLVLPDGRSAGGTPGQLRLRLTPQTFYQNDPDQPEFGVNSRGFRGPEWQPVAERPIVAVVGGSAAFGVGVEERQTFTAVMRDRHPEFDTINAAVEGYLSSQELALTLYELVDLEPAIVVAFDGWNDLYDPYWRLALEGDASLHDAVNLNFLRMGERLVDYRSAETSLPGTLAFLGRGISRNSTLLGWVGRLGAPSSSPDPPQLGAGWKRHLFDTYTTNMRKLRDVVAARGGRLVVVLQPELGQITPVAPEQLVYPEIGAEHFLTGDHYWSTFPELYREFRAEVARVLEAEEIRFIDGTEILRPLGVRLYHRPGDKSADPMLTFFDPVHLSEAGHVEVGRSLGREIAALLENDAGDDS